MEENLKPDTNDDPKNSPTLEDYKTKKSFITFSKVNKYFLFPFLTPIFLVLTNIVDYIIEEKILENPMFVTVIFDQLAIVSAGLLYFFSNEDKSLIKDKDKDKESSIDKPNKTFEYIYNENERDIDIKKLYILIAILAVLMAAYEIIDGIYSDDLTFELELFFFIFIPIFCKIILKENYYKHHWFSLGIAFIGILIISIPVILAFAKDYIGRNILNFFEAIFYSLFCVILKYVIKEFYISIFLISLIVSVLSLIIEIIAFIIYSLIENHDFSFFKNVFELSSNLNTGTIIVCFFFYFLFRAVSQIFLLFTMTYFSPLLLIITIIISPFLFWIFSAIIEEKSTIDKILYPIGYIIVVFAALVYNEIIIFNFWGLSKNTKKYIEKRLLDDTSDLKKMEIELKSEDQDNDSDNSNDD